jgi:hypothetical protein
LIRQLNSAASYLYFPAQVSFAAPQKSFSSFFYQNEHPIQSKVITFWSVWAQGFSSEEEAVKGDCQGGTIGEETICKETKRG